MLFSLLLCFLFLYPSDYSILTFTSIFIYIYPYLLWYLLSLPLQQPPRPASLPFFTVSHQPPCTAWCTQRCHHFSHYFAFSRAGLSVVMTFSHISAQETSLYASKPSSSVTSSKKPSCSNFPLACAPQGMWVDLYGHRYA